MAKKAYHKAEAAEVRRLANAVAKACIVTGAELLVGNNRWASLRKRIHGVVGARGDAEVHVLQCRVRWATSRGSSWAAARGRAAAATTAATGLGRRLAFSAGTVRTAWTAVCSLLGGPAGLEDGAVVEVGGLKKGHRQ